MDVIFKPLTNPVMKIFLYTACQNDCQDNCSWQQCSYRCAAHLSSMDDIGKLVILDSGAKLTCTNSRMLRNGDALILYASDSNELQDLIRIREVFEPFRVILIVGREDVCESSECHLLNPRYMTSMEGSWKELNAVIMRMNSDRRYYGSSVDSDNSGQRISLY